MKVVRSKEWERRLERQMVADALKRCEPTRRRPAPVLPEREIEAGREYERHLIAEAERERARLQAQSAKEWLIAWAASRAAARARLKDGWGL